MPGAVLARDGQPSYVLSPPLACASVLHRLKPVLLIPGPGALEVLVVLGFGVDGDAGDLGEFFFDAVL